MPPIQLTCHFHWGNISFMFTLENRSISCYTTTQFTHVKREFSGQYSTYSLAIFRHNMHLHNERFLRVTFFNSKNCIIQIFLNINSNDHKLLFLAMYARRRLICRIKEIILSKFKLQLHNYAHFWTNIFGEAINLLKQYHGCSSMRMDLKLNNSWRFISH